MTIIINNNIYIEITHNDFKFKTDLASFDLDNTIICTKSKKKFPIDENDWEFNENVEKTLNYYNKKNYCIVIITNQMGLKKFGINKWCDKIKAILKKLNLPIKIYASLEDDIYRKPNLGFWDLIKNKINHKNSFYCGDALGRKNDHSDTDLKFALNTGLQIKAPEEIFNKIKINITMPIYFNFNNFEKKENKINFYNDKLKDLIIMCGYPGSGKSTFVNKYLIKNHYEIISLDELKNKNKCLKLCEKYMNDNKKIVIDNTNPSKESRKIFIDLAKSQNYNVRCLKMTTTLNHSMHNNIYRYLYKNKNKVPKIVYNIYNKKYEEPELNEGYYEIISINPDIPTDNKYFFYLY